MLPIHRVITLWRLEKGMTQAELAQRAGLPRPNLSVIEQGGRDLTLSTLRRLAQALGIRPGLLADGIGPDSGGSWSRESLDRMARALAGEKPPSLNPKEKKAVEQIYPLVRQKLRLQGKKEKAGSTSTERETRKKRFGWMHVKSQFTPSEWQSLLNRIEKIGQHFHE